MTHPKVDWSKAPEWAVAWACEVMDEGRYGTWLGYELTGNGIELWFDIIRADAPMFRYRGTVENSLTLRPPKRKKMSKADRLRLEHGMTA